MVHGKLCEVAETFRLYLISSLLSPNFSAEDQARTTLVDFTVTQAILEDQLLGRVVGKEQESLEKQYRLGAEELSLRAKELHDHDQLLMQRLSACEGSLLDNNDLLDFLTDAEMKIAEVRDRLAAARQMGKSVQDRRENFRAAATRGALLYFTAAKMAHVSHFYQISMDQFLVVFENSVDCAEKGFVNSRLDGILDQMTFAVCQHVARALYEKDKLAFKLLVLLQILRTAGRITQDEADVFPVGGAVLGTTPLDQRPESLSWLTHEAWLGVLALTQRVPLFRSPQDDMTATPAEWRS
eukprot:scaffold615_cov147-Pinguiococcus_pyrenoidosus.AAC.1